MFQLGPDGVGYYSDLPKLLLLEPLLPPPSQPDDLANFAQIAALVHQRIKPRRARRQRNKDGTRKKKKTKTRREAAIANWIDSNSAPPCIIEQTATLHDRWWPSAGLWAFLTVNPNSWKTAVSEILPSAEDDVILMQESNTFKESAHKVAGSTARRLGWSHAIGYAHRTAGTMGSGGCAILARKGTGIHSPAKSGIPDFCSHRIHLAWVACVARGGMHCMSVYLIDSVGMNPSNILICEQAALVLRALCGPWICSGDWNLEPDVLAASGFPKLVDGVVFAASLPTCGEKKFDYYVVSRSIAHAVVGMQRIEGVGMEPHYPTRLLIRGDARRFAIRKLVRPTRVPPVLQHGPQPQPPSYQPIHDNLDHVPTRLRDGGADAEVQGFLDNAMRAWYQAA